ncbi:MAG: methanethiol S-methyltransferase [Halioglobus sp.]
MQTLSAKTETDDSKIARATILAYGAVSYVIFFASFLYAIGFIGGFGVPTTLDGPREVSLTMALLTNIGLLAAFAMQHSIMARPAFKRWWTKIIPQSVERSTYVLFSSLALFAVFIGWQPMGGMIWEIQNTNGQIALYSLFALGWGVVLYSTFLINHFDLFGLRQVWLAYQNKPYTELKFVMPWMYRIIRHPLYFGWLMVMWFTPTMSVAHLLFALLCTAYIFIGIYLEERDLKAAHPDYADYQKNVPMIVPGLRKKRATQSTDTGVMDA